MVNLLICNNLEGFLGILFSIVGFNFRFFSGFLFVFLGFFLLLLFCVEEFCVCVCEVLSNVFLFIILFLFFLFLYLVGVLKVLLKWFFIIWSKVLGFSLFFFNIKVCFEFNVFWYNDLNFLIVFFIFGFIFIWMFLFNDL